MFSALSSVAVDHRVWLDLLLLPLVRSTRRRANRDMMDQVSIREVVSFLYKEASCMPWEEAGNPVRSGYVLLSAMYVGSSDGNKNENVGV